MPLDPEAHYARICAAAGNDGRLPLTSMTGWEVFPFEPDGLRVVAVTPPELPEPPRSGEHGLGCRACDNPSRPVWSDGNWRLTTLVGGAPLVLLLQPRLHHDLVDLPDDRAAELGRLIVSIARSVESLPHIARAHVARWGDGGAHLHVFFYARPAGFSQFRGTCFAIWDELLPPPPADVQAADALLVAAQLSQSYGGRTGEQESGAPA